MRVFVYGTLTEPARVQEVLDSFVFVGSATLDGLHAVEGRYPTLAPGGAVGGRLLRTDSLDALDAYEGLADGLYVRAHVPLHGERGGDGSSGDSVDAEDSVDADASTSGDDPTGDDSPTDATSPRVVTSAGRLPENADDRVAVYVGDPARLNAAADWPGDGSLAQRVESYLRDHAVSVRRR